MGEEERGQSGHGTVDKFLPVDIPGVDTPSVDIWCASLDLAQADVDPLMALLSPDERQRAERFRFEHHRRRFVVSRGLLRRLLAHYLTCAPTAIAFAYGDHGKPFLAEPSSPLPLEFNLAHADDQAIYAFAMNRQVGIDLETSRQFSQLDHLIKRCLSAREQATFHNLPEDQRKARFLTYWTCKEAYIKATGQGLSFPLPQVEVLFQDGAPWRLHIESDPTPWSLAMLHCIPGFTSALVVEGGVPQLVLRQWSDLPVG